MNTTTVYHILQTHVPLPAVDYCFTLWKESPFELKITKARQTKIGDFTSKRTALHPRITLNHDLNPFLFLITYVHEVAHLRVFLVHRHSVDPHGIEWKCTFKDLMLPMLDEIVFPPAILEVLSKHMVNPKASSYADSKLTNVLRQFDPATNKVTVLDEVPEGSIFRLNGRYFKKGKLRRTRVLCQELRTRRHYLVPCDATISDVQLSLL